MIIQKYGEAKTNTIQPRQNNGFQPNRSTEEIGSEKWQDPFILAGKQIKMASKVKILCQILSNDCNDIEHSPVNEN